MGIIKRIFTKQEAIEFIGCNNEARPYRIVEGLERLGFRNIEKVGRGKNLTFSCEFTDDTDEQCYYIFKDILINEFDFGKNMDYDKVLSLIDFHITNIDFLSQLDICEILQINTSTLTKYRKRLDNKILKNIDKCQKKVMGHDTDKDVRIDITDLYYDFILKVFRKELMKIYTKYPKSLRSEIAIFRNKRNKSFIILDATTEDFEDIKVAMDNQMNNYIASYPLYLLDNNEELIRNQFLSQRLFQLILNENGFDYVYFLRLYEISEELKNDEELLNLIKRAIKFLNK